jgi:chromosome partitioning protein
MEELIENARQYNDDLQAHVLVTRVSTNPGLYVEAREVYAFVEKECPSLSMASPLIYERVAWRRCLREGLAVFEMKPKDAKATEELERLYEEIWSGV